MSFIIKDTRPQSGGQTAYLTGLRKMRDPHGRECEAADFGDKSMAKGFSENEARKRCEMLNKIAGCEQFVVEKLSVYGTTYGRPRHTTNGFRGMREVQNEPQMSGGFKILNNDGYNGF